MKKIISALVLGAAPVGFATADLKISLNYRDGGDLFQYYNKRESGEKAKKVLFNMQSWGDAVADSLALTASGNIFTFKAQVNPYVSYGSENRPAVKILTVGANVGDFSFTTGVLTDGDGEYRVKSDVDAGSEEGMVSESFKPGSTLGGLTMFSTNKIIMDWDENSSTGYFAQAGYKFGFGDSVSLKVTASALSTFRWRSATKSGDGTEEAIGDLINPYAIDNKPTSPYLGWSVFLDLEVKGIFGAEVFAKGRRYDEDKYGFAFGGYAKLLCLPVLKDSALGGAVGLLGGDVTEWSADLRLRFAFGDRVSLTTMNNFTKKLRNAVGEKVSKDGYSISDNANLAAKGNDALANAYGKLSFKSSQLLWDMIMLRFKLNDTLTVIGTVGQMTDFDSGTAKDGTEIYVYPHVQIFATKSSFVSVGVVGALYGIGADKSKNDKFDISVRVPLTFRVRM